MPPGGEGTIKIKVNTNGYGGRKMNKSIRVETNDPNNKNFNLKITGDVEKFVTISPSRLRLSGESGASIKGSVKIIPEKKYPFKILSVSAKNGKDIHQELKEAEHKEGKGYLLTVENIKKDAGRYFDVITLKTDSKIKPEIQISVYGNISSNSKKK
ncbi:MAG: hypothetical protein JRI92_07085 [Deltaproteobacteria bacterium]|nr:hypothetical protein [Deltaproteobacteria bacterium]